jgi:hypothetical protein
LRLDSLEASIHTELSWIRQNRIKIEDNKHVVNVARMRRSMVMSFHHILQLMSCESVAMDDVSF